MAVKLSPVFNDAQLDSSGNPFSGALLFTYASGSSTKQTTYQESTGTTPHANPIVLNSRGEPSAPIWLTVGETYKFRLCISTESDPPSTSIRDVDVVSGVNDTTSTFDQWVSGPAPTFIGTTSFSLVGDQTTVFHVGRRLKTTNSGGTIYSTITASAFTTVTTVTVVNDSGVLDSGISAVSYGLLSSDNFSSPLLTDSSPIVSGSADKTKKVRIEADGITTATTRTITMPDADVTLGLGAAAGVGQTFLGADVNLNNTANYFNVCNTGSIGASGQVWLLIGVCTLVDTAGAAAFRLRIWDGSATVYADAALNTSAANANSLGTVAALVSLSGATTFHLSARDATSTSGVAQTSSGGTANKATSITAIRLV